MPSLPLSLFKQSARERLQQFKLTLPTAVLSNTSDPAAILSGTGHMAKHAAPPNVESGWKSAAPHGARPLGKPMLGAHRAVTAMPTSVPPGLFQAASNDKRDVDFQSAVNTEYEKFLDEMCKAIVNGFDMWRQSAVLKDVVINGSVANGGSVEGGSLRDFIKANAPRHGLFGKAASHSDALAAAIGEGWRQLTGTLRVPGLAWYPTFAAYAGPVAPPTPNVPTPFSALPVQRVFMSVTVLERDAIQRVAGPKAFAAEEVFTAILTALESALDLWFNLQQITNVLGTGPVPTYAPPLVTIGPVMDGQVVPTPGAFAS